MEQLNQLKFLVDQPQTVPLNLPEQYPFVLLIASGLYFVQMKTAESLLQKQAEVMGRKTYMEPFEYQHNLAFGPKSADHGLHTDGGAPEDGTGLGWYSQNRLSYREWHRLACVRQSLNEQVNNNPRVIFNLLVGGISLPWLSIGFGSLYLLARNRRAACLKQDNGVLVARKSISRSLLKFSSFALSLVASASLTLAIKKNTNVADHKYGLWVLGLLGTGLAKLSLSEL